MELKKCKGIVIDSRDFRDNRHIHTLFTDILGKIQLISSGSRKIRSENRESLLLLSRSEFMLKPGRNFWGVRGTDLEKSFQVLEYENYTLAVNIINILNKVIPPDFIDERIYILTVHYIDFIEKSQTDMHELIRLTFVMKLLYFLGQFPGLDKCECGSMSGDEFYACTRDSS
ncbi:MAG: DNA repair protein RecO, partial [Candidatus Muiribacteriaceae bacterium]